MKFALKFFESAPSSGPRDQRVAGLLPASAKIFLRDRIFDVVGVCLALITVSMFAAVVTYHPSDASLNSANSLPPTNLLGHSGAIFADLTMQSVGFAVYFLIIGMAVWSWRLIRKQPLSHVSWRFIALILAVIVSSVWLSGLFVGESLLMANKTGGSVGSLVHIRLVETLRAAGWNDGGFQIALIAVFLTGLFWIFGIGLTWLEWRAIGSGILSLGRNIAKFNRASKFFSFRQDTKKRITPSLIDNEKSDYLSETLSKSTVGDARPKELMPTRKGLVAPRQPKPKTGKRAAADCQGKLNLEPGATIYTLPPLELLELPYAGTESETINKDALEQNAKFLASVLKDFGVKGEISKVRPGPVVTLYELEPAPGTKTSRVISLSDDIARSMSAVSVRVAVVPGRNVIGIELPNVTREVVLLREILASTNFETAKSKLPLALGKDIGGGAVVVDLSRMPHLLIAGTTGAGKSVAMNTMILSLLYSLNPEQCRLIMIDPKMLELSVYEGIPHLLTPVVTDPGKAIVALKWAVREMEDRYRNMSQLGVRNIAGYNTRIEEAIKKGEHLTRSVQTGFDETGKPVIESQSLPMDPLPFIVVVVDEMADLMLVAGKDVEAAIQRLAQMARAAGIHLIMATQRPSVDVITGTVKANFPTRVSFQVTSKIDSRTILGEQGAEQLLGQGDMLYMAGGGRVMRVHGPFVSDDEVEHVVDHLKLQKAPAYIDEITVDDGSSMGLEGKTEKAKMSDELYDEAVAIVSHEGKASTSFIQRHLQIGYNRAARIIEQMEKEGVISPANRVGRREVLVGAH